MVARPFLYFKMNKYLVMAVMAVCCANSFAQVVDNPVSLPYGKWSSIPSAYTCDGKPIIYVRETEDLTDYENTVMRVYDANLDEVKTIRINGYVVDVYRKGGENVSVASPLCLTQTLFNDDEKFECVTAIFDEKQDYYTLGLNICSEEGKVLQTLKFPSGMRIVYINEDKLFVLETDENTRFLCCKMVDENSDGITYAYRIKKSSTETSAVSIETTPVKLNVSPRLVTRGEVLAVDSPNADISEVVVMDSVGRIVFEVKPSVGSKTVKIDSQSFGLGLHIVNVKYADGGNESSKIMVKQ